MAEPHAFVARFVTVAGERLTRARACVAGLESGDATLAQELLAELRRELHTLKGEARVVGLPDVAHAVHAVEELASAPGAEKAWSELAAQLDALEDLAFRAGREPTEKDRAGGAAVLLERLLGGSDDAFVRVSLDALSGLADTAAELRVGEADLRRLLDEIGGLLSDRKRDLHATDTVLRRVLSRGRQLAFEQHHRLERLHDRLRLSRMVRLATLFEPFPRAVQKLAEELGKEVDVVIDGASVEVDRQVLDVMKEPLVHLVRNALDHGLETPDERRGAGKAQRGRLALRARAVGANVIIEVEDDGRGIDVEQLAASLAARGVPSEIPEDDHALLELLCLHGVSTRSRVTELSGRGVGLDVVKRKTESVGGRLSLDTTQGRGTRFVLEVPMTTVLSVLMCVELDGVLYGMGAHEVELVHGLSPPQLEAAGSGQSVRVGDEVVAIVDLGTLLDGRPRDLRQRKFFFVATAPHARLALAVDRIVGNRPVLEQRLDTFLERTPMVRSVAVLSTGEVAVALDVPELVRRGGDGGASRASSEALPVAPPPRRATALVVDDSELTRDVVVSVLREMGLEVSDAANGQRALEALATFTPDVMITDLDMPLVDGFELLRRVRATAATARVPVVVLSTRGSAEDIARASALGADAYLVKTRLELDQVREVVRRHLGSPPASGGAAR
jgi:two-component system chemotaxis sensor kinase CheA